MSASGRDKAIKNAATVVFTALIAVIGAGMMSLTSSPQMKGAAMLWIPAALQLMAGVWLGPTRGLIAGGLGAYAAGIIAYGGFGLSDIIMNPIAGGIANSWLPSVLFRVLRIDPAFDVEIKHRPRLLILSIFMGLLVVFAGLVPLITQLTPIIAYSIAVAVLIAGMFVAFRGVAKSSMSLMLGVIIAIVISAISAIIGSFGVTLTGQGWMAALLGTGLGWFMGDAVSCILGLYMLALYTHTAREVGIADPL